jgi:GntR family transcriptional regulator/MocR family aminotransferase
LKSLIHEGSLTPGQGLPSSRALASDLGLSRNTVLIAFDQLRSEGYVSARPRAGLFVVADLRAAPPPAPPGVAAKPARLGGPPPFRPCQPDTRLFPLALWNRLRQCALRLHGPALLGYQSAHVLGLPVLRTQLARYLRDSRGVQCAPEQIAITSGSQQALYFIAQLARRRAAVLLEDPGYLGARDAFRAAGARLIPVPVDDEGMVPPALIPAGALVYTTPSRQFPTGATLPVARRLALLQAAAASGAWIIEDDYDSEFRYGRSPLPSLHSLDPAGRVIYVGTMSKVLSPSLRIGYVVLPREWMTPFAELRAVVEDHGPLVDQATLAEFIASGSFYSHIRRCRKEYADRLDTFLSTAEQLRLPLRFPHTDGGVNQCGRWLEPRAEAVWEGLEVPALSRYALRSQARGLVFGFTAFDHAAIKAGLRRFAAMLGSI